MALGIGENAVTFELPGVDGKTHRLEDYTKNDAVAVIFTCNHCPYVLAWEDRLIEIQKDYAGKNVQIHRHQCQQRRFPPGGQLREHEVPRGRKGL